MNGQAADALIFRRDSVNEWAEKLERDSDSERETE